MKSQKRIIRVNSCADCPFQGKCKAWKALTKKERVFISISNSVPHDFMLKNCDLEEAE